MKRKTLPSEELKNGKTFRKTVNLTHLFNIEVELYYALKTYHVRAFNHFNGSSVSDKLAWNSFKNLKDANKRFYELVEMYKENKF